MSSGHTVSQACTGITAAVRRWEEIDEILEAVPAEAQYLLYAEVKRSLLICPQALDAAGKDGTIRHVLGAMNPQGTHVHGFKTPSKEELAHDFLWRFAQQTPRTGEVAIFNRSHLEDQRVGLLRA